MNSTHLEHAVIGLAVQCLLWPLLGKWISGSLIVAVFLGREIAQHEYAGGGAARVGYFYGLLHHWSVDSTLDVAAPALACATLAWVASRRQRSRTRARPRIPMIDRLIDRKTR